MKLGDVMSAMNLAVYAEVALVVFFAAFIAIVLAVFRRKNQLTWERARQMPLNDETPREPRQPTVFEESGSDD